ncbi:MAG: YegP family protein [Bacteroidota bacterium]
MVEIVKNNTGDYQLHFKSSTGSSLLKSIPFKSEADAEATLHQIMAKPIFERRTNHQGKFMISLKTASGEQVGQSNMYSSEAGMENGIKNLMKSFSNP